MASLGYVGELETAMVWRIPDFLSLEGKTGEYYESPPFHARGEHWHLYVYPRGCVASGCIVVALVMKGVVERHVTWEAGLKKEDGTLEDRKEDSHTFRPGQEECCLLLLKRSNLERRMDELMPFGMLTIVCGLKGDEMHNVAHAACAMEIQEPKAVASTSQMMPFEFGPNKLSHDLTELMDSEEDTDLLIIVKGVEFFVHRSIIGARTPVFRDMLRHEMAEQDMNQVSIDVCEPEVFRAFLQFIYSSQVDLLTPENVFGLYGMADQYDVYELKSTCIEFIQRTLSVETVCEAIGLALTHNLGDLRKQGNDFFVRYMEQVMQTSKWLDFMKEHCREANKLVLIGFQKLEQK